MKILNQFFSRKVDFTSDFRSATNPGCACTAVAFLQSEPDHGATFSFDIPVESADIKAVTVSSTNRRVIGHAPGQPECRLLVFEEVKK